MLGWVEPPIVLSQFAALSVFEGTAQEGAANGPDQNLHCRKGSELWKNRTAMMAPKNSLIDSTNIIRGTPDDDRR